MLTTTVGYLLASFTSGANIARIGIGGFLLVGAAISRALGLWGTPRRQPGG